MRQAYKRLLSNERSLSAKMKLDAFQAVLHEYIDLDHAHFIPQDELTNRPHFYLPVHGVFKDSSSTTKCRAVFDASAVTTSGSSLNDTLLAGPSLYPLLTDILVRFHCHRIGLSADISKMFREILLNPEHRDLHRFLMRGAHGVIRDCRMKRLTFGINCSPSLATQVLHHLANFCAESHPTASAAILSAFYVNDFLSGADDVEAADRLRIELCDLFSQAGMILRKRRTNYPEVKNKIPDELQEKSQSPLPLTQPDQSPKALGIHWDVSSDSLHVAIPPSPDLTKVTKRTIASTTASVFDVLGLFAPAVIQARIILQETWKRSLSWDKPVPPDLLEKWKSWTEDLPTIVAHPIPRRLSSSPRKIVNRSLHRFCDASVVAYGAALYLRSVHDDGSTTVSLITAKARVAPVNPITIPEAELQGALLLAKLLHHTMEVLSIPPSHVFAWTDSEIVLYWLPKQPSQLDRFVAHRINSIQSLTPPQAWRHVRSADNPADLTSRGVRARDLATSTLWWSGPPWLSLAPSAWPVHKLSKPPSATCCLAIRPSPAMSLTQSSFLDQLWSRYSSFHSLVRIVARIMRLPKKPDVSTSDVLSSEELLKAKSKIFHLAQLQSLPEAFYSAVNKTLLPKGH